MNALRSIVEQNLTSALILEDDADWDLRVRPQLKHLSHAARALPHFLARAKTPSEDMLHISQMDLARRSSIPLPSISTHSTHNDPYGHDWDVLWLGHCGAKLPPPSPESPNRVVIEKDGTVPEPRYLKPMARADLDKIATVYPPHTRVIHQANETLCTIAYAVTQQGARRVLFEHGIREFSKGFDFALNDWCNGKTAHQRKHVKEQKSQKETKEEQSLEETTKEEETVAAALPMCLTVQPPLFGHHFQERGVSDIVGVSGGGRPKKETRYVRWSVRMNLE
jgi:hypothetical protein